VTYGALDWCVCVCVCVCALQTAIETERDRTIVICCTYSSAVLPTEVSGIHFSSLTDRSLLLSLVLRFSFVNVSSICLLCCCK